MRTRERLKGRQKRTEMLQYHLEHYRSARRAVAIRAARKQAVQEVEEHEVSYHAIGVAEELDRLAAGGVLLD